MECSPFQKLLVTQLAKEIPHLLWKSKFHYFVHKSPLLDYLFLLIAFGISSTLNIAVVPKLL